MNVSNIAFAGAVAAAVAVAVGFMKVNPWLYIAGGLMVVGFVTKPTTPGTGV